MERKQEIFKRRCNGGIVDLALRGTSSEQFIVVDT